MNIRTSGMLMLVGLPALVAAFGSGRQCKRVEPASWAQIDYAEYTRATWYAQEQETNSYQPADSLYCITATYELEENRKVQAAWGEPWDGLVISVYNQGNEGGVNGPLSNTVDPSPYSTNPLCARVVDPENNRLSVAPCFLPNEAAGDYWPLILRADEQGRYTAVAVIGGQPTQPQPDGGCSLPSVAVGDFDGVGAGEGLWILTREPMPPVQLIEEIKGELIELGVSTANLLKVPQGSCSYDGYRIKPNE